MKLLKLVNSLQDAKKIAATLKSVGILIFISNEPTDIRNARQSVMGVVQIGVWVVLDYQYDDALAVLENPNHIVEEPLTPQEMFLMARDSKPPYSATTKSMIKLVAAIVIAIVILCVAGYILRK